MRLVIQRVEHASVVVAGHTVGAIGPGLLVLCGFAPTDAEADLQWCAAKLAALRIFNDAQGHMNLSVQDVQGDVLLVSQFTLLADVRKGARPSFMGAAAPQAALLLYERFIALCTQALGRSVQTGQFGADMQVHLLNNGPVTLVLER